MMAAIHRKLLRDMRHMWTQLLAIAAVIAAGVAVCITMLSALASLQLSRDQYYTASRFADLFATVRRAPESTIGRLRDIPGVETVESRVVADVTIDVPGLAEPAVARLVSIPDETPPLLNLLRIRRGAYPEPGSGDHVLVSEAFATAHGLESGDRISAVINGRWRRLRVTGVALSPEYVYSIRGGDLFPDDKRFGIFWMRRLDLATALDLDGAFNDVVFRLSRDCNTQEVIASVDRILDRYGGLGAYTRKDQTSAWYLQNELAQLQNMGRVTPFIFAGVAAFLLHVVISRLVSTQREQIGVLKAFGYSNSAIAMHYTAFALAIAAAGITLGVAVGAWAGAEWTRLYALFFRFPSLTFTLPRSVVLGASASAAAVAALASIGAARRAALVPPAEAMRPAAPAAYRRGIAARLGIERLIPLSARMVIRNVERRPFRALLSIVAIALAVAIVIVGIFTVDAVHYLTDVQFNMAQRQDVTVAFTETKSHAALYELQHVPGVMRAEPVRAVAVRLRNGTRSRRIGLIGLSPTATLARVIDARLRPVRLPPAGIVLNDALASALGVSRGDEITIDVLEGARPSRLTTVADIVTEYLGLAAYMDLDAVNRLMREGPVISGGYLQVDAAQASELYAHLKSTPGIGSVTISDVARRSFEETLATVISTVTTMFGVFGAAIAFAVIYNNSRIAFAERARELGSLHVLGFSHAEMAEIVLGEMAILTAIAIPVGLLAGRLLGALVVVLFSTELARIPLVIAPSTNGAAVAITLVSAALSGLAIWRQLLRLDAVSVLKAPE
jgi:putative ABC transport system permease protein